MKKFKTPIVMEVTKEQYQNDLRDKLLEFGYVEENVKISETYKYLLNHFGFNTKLFVDYEGTSFNNAYVINSYNPELYLALAAMTEGEVPIVGEWMIRINDNYLNERDDMFIVKEVNDSLNNYRAGAINSENPTGNGCFRKATKEELIAHFNNTKKGTIAKAITNYLKLVNKSEAQLQKEEVTRNHRKLVRAAEGQIRAAESKIEDKQDDIIDIQEDIIDVEVELTKAKVDLSTTDYSQYVNNINVVSSLLHSLKVKEAYYKNEIATITSIKKFNEEILEGLK